MMAEDVYIHYTLHDAVEIDEHAPIILELYNISYSIFALRSMVTDKMY
jgi:hypothetical protein